MRNKPFTTTTQRIKTLEVIFARKNLSSTARKLATALLMFHLNNRTGQCNPTILTNKKGKPGLAERLGLHHSSVYRAIEELRAKIDMQWDEQKGFRFELEPELCVSEPHSPSMVLAIGSSGVVGRRECLIAVPMGSGRRLRPIWRNKVYLHTTLPQLPDTRHSQR